MYIELLNQYASGIESLKIQPPVTKSDLCKAEKTLNILFPNELKMLLLETNGDSFLLLSLEFIIKDNLDFRSMNPEIIEPELFNFSEFLFSQQTVVEIITDIELKIMQLHLHPYLFLITRNTIQE